MGDKEIDPALESEWLNHIEEFEHQFEHAQRIPLRQYLGYPTVKASAHVPDEMLDDELNALLDLMVENNVALDCICAVEDRELYRFIVEELLDEEIDDMRIPGMTCHYTYEEFHPNDGYDVAEAVRSLVYGLLRSTPKSQEYVRYYSGGNANEKQTVCQRQSNPDLRSYSLCKSKGGRICQ